MTVREQPNDREQRIKIRELLEAAGRSRLDVRGHALDLAAAHHREVWRDKLDDDGRRAQVTADAAAYERYLLTGETHADTGTVPVSRGVLRECLRELDLEQGRADQNGKREIAWYAWRGELEKLLGLLPGELYAGNPDGSYPEDEEDAGGAPA